MIVFESKKRCSTTTLNDIIVATMSLYDEVEFAPAESAKAMVRF